MILFLYGPDTYRSGKKLKEIVAKYKEIHKSGMSFSDLSAEDSTFDDFRNTANTASMFEEKKLVVLRGFVSLKDFADRFLSWDKKNYLKDSKDVIAVFVDGATNKDNSLLAWLTQNVQCQEFNMLEGVHLTRWAKRYLEQSGIEIEFIALNQLLLLTGGDLWLFENEVQKLNSYKNGSKISREDMKIFYTPSLEAHIFSFTDAVAEGNAVRAFRFLRGHLEVGDSDNYIFSMVHQQFRNIIIAQHFLETGERNISRIAQKARIHPYVVKKSLGFAKCLGKDKIKKIYKNLVDLDRDIKTGGMKAQDALETLILFNH